MFIPLAPRPIPYALCPLPYAQCILNRYPLRITFAASLIITVHEISLLATGLLPHIPVLYPAG